MVFSGKREADAITTDFKGKHILSLTQFSKSAIQKLFKTTDKLIIRIAKRKDVSILTRSVTTLLFFEPSTRTFTSFSSGIKKMGGETIELLNPGETSSFAKNESLQDSIRVFSTYTDLIIIRHPEEGFIHKAARVSKVPVISAGEGAGEHPTQALYDLYTIYQRHKRLSNLKILILGDARFSRSIHSLILGLTLYENNVIYLLSPMGLELSKDQERSFGKKIKLVTIKNEKEIPKDCDLWYSNRIQKERFENLALYKKALKSFPVITTDLLKKYGNKKMIIMDPLPRVGNIDEEVDKDPRAKYLTDQLENGLYIRMALVGLVSGRI